MQILRQRLRNPRHMPSLRVEVRPANRPESTRNGKAKARQVSAPAYAGRRVRALGILGFTVWILFWYYAVIIYDKQYLLH